MCHIINLSNKRDFFEGGVIMNRRISKFKFLRFVLALLVLSLAILLTACNNNSDDKEFSSDGIVFTLKGGNYEVTGYNGNAKYVVIPSIHQSRKVTGIADGAFSGCSEIVKIKIEGDVGYIGKSAFSGCTSLQSVSLPLWQGEIGDYAFSDCYSLQSVRIRGNSVGNYAFYNCEALTSVEIETLFIRSYAFANCTKLSDVTISDKVWSLNGSAFDNTAWYNNQPDGLVYAGKTAYKYKGTMPKNTSITIKEGTKAVADYAFSSCDGLAKITFPNSLERIEDNAFEYCRGLTSVELPEKIYDIGNYAFFSTGLKSVIIPESLESIGGSAFASCTSLTEVKWKAIDCNGGYILSHGRNEVYPIFRGCTNLSMIYIYKKTKKIPPLLNLLEPVDSIFMNETCADITFDGTKAEWSKAVYYVRRNCKIICSDGVY